MTKVYIILFLLIYSSGLCQNYDKRIIVDTLAVDSIIQVYYNNGRLFFQVPYKNGLQNGWYEQYNENGSIWIKELRINGKTVDGYNIAYYDNGKIYQHGYFKNGHEIGKWYCYDTTGQLNKIHIYNRKGEYKKCKIWEAGKNKWINTPLY
jgi:antitoxin component YwqK of YwqJK toxin-antitoxin module